MDWSLLGCGRGGHLTYAPDEPDLRRQMRAVTGAGVGGDAGPGSGLTAGVDDGASVAAGAGPGGGEAWQCLRCGAFVPSPPDRSGPAAQAPRVRRGKELRSALILRIFAIERYLRALIFGAAAVGVWRFSVSRTSLQRAFDHDLPAVRRLYEDLGFSFSHSKLIGLIQHALRLDSRTLGYLAIGLAVYAVIEVIEGTGLWLLKRWGEYFAMVATSIGLPYEIYELIGKVTVLRAAAFAVNLALVVYLVVTKRLLGVRGGKRAYEERLREGSIIEQATEAAAADLAARAARADAGTAAPDTTARASDATANTDESVSREVEGADEAGEIAGSATDGTNAATTGGTDEAGGAVSGAHGPSRAGHQSR